jgi:acyl-CoA thioesterase-2
MSATSTFPEIGPETGSGCLQAVIPEHLCVGASADPFLYGGSGLAACIAAMERITGQPAIFATVQFVSRGRCGDTITFTPEHCSGGASIKQCRLSAHIADQPFAFLLGAAGQRSDPARHQGSHAPAVPPPEQCAQRSVARLVSSNLNSLFEFRLAGGQLPDRRDWTGDGSQDLAFWMRKRSGEPVQRLDLPVIADFASLALPSALGRHASGSSLDNSIRFAAQADEEWVLVSMQVASLLRGTAHISTQIYSAAGSVLAVASQSMAVRDRPPV